MTSGKSLAVGSAFFTTGAGVAAGFGVMNVQANRDFLSLPVVLGASLAAVGLIFLLLGLVVRESSAPSSQIKLTQHGGKGSRNYQAGGNLSIDHLDES